MRDEAKTKYKYDEALKFCKGLVSQFKSEERRRASFTYNIFMHAL